MQIQQSNIGTVNTIQKKFLYLHELGEQIKIAVSLFLLQFLFVYDPTFYFNMRKKL